MSVTTTPPARAGFLDRRSNVRSMENECLAAIQRGRMIAAMYEASAMRGVGLVTVGDIVGTAGASRRAFYDQFDNCADCVLAAFDEAVARAARRVLPAYRSEDRWQDKARAALEGLLIFLQGDPHMGRFLVVEAFAGGQAVMERRTQLLSRIVDAVDREAKGTSHDPVLSRITAEGVVGAVLSVIHTRMLHSARPCLRELLNPLMSIVVLPYLGRAAASRELERSVATPPVAEQLPVRAQLAGVELRLTYRTFQVLATIAERPGLSNRAIGGAVGVSDQGQMSKLLSRLKRLGLIDSTPAKRGLGAANAWEMTQKGKQVWATISSQAPARTLVDRSFGLPA